MPISLSKIDSTMAHVLAVLASCTVIILVGIFVFLLYTGAQAFGQLGISDFLTTTWNPTSYHTPEWGILSLLVGTLLVSFFSLGLAIPIGLAVAVYLAEIASFQERQILKPLIEMIASVPSVVLGFLGLLYIAPLVASLFNKTSGLNALTAGILVAVAALPTIASISEEALSAVGKEYRDASSALGASKLQTITQVVIPAARSGIVAAIMLGLGRIVGETMIVLMVAGNSRALPKSFLDPVSPLTSTIAIDIKEVVVGGLHWQTLFALGCLLFIFTFIINMLADVLINKERLA